MSEGKLYDVFLSHNSADKPAVEALARLLEDEAGLYTFLDKWHLVPGEPWQEALEDALDNSRTCAVFIGPTGIGPWENEEMRSAIDTRVRNGAYRVVPVLLPGASLPELGELPRFLARLTWVDFRDGLDDTHQFQRLVAGIRGVAPGRSEKSPATLQPLETPYRGLEVFDEEHSKFFFGRDALTQHLVEALRGTRFLAVLGPSGSGKSSLVRAGLLPRLRRGALPSSDQWRYCILKPGPRPLEELALALAKLLGKDDLSGFQSILEANERELHLQTRFVLRDESPETHLCLVIDQFEEIFTLCQDRTERERLVDLLLYAATVAAGQTVVVLTMRADFLGRAATYPPLADVLSSHQFLVSPMTEEEIREAIAKPAQLVGVQCEEGLTDTIVQEMGHEPGALPLMEHALARLWEQVNSDRLMTARAYRTIGGVQGALAQRAEAIYDALASSEEQHLARRILLRLTQPGEGTEDTRRRANKQDFFTNSEEESTMYEVLQAFTDARLLVASEKGQVDVAHEALIRGWPRLRQWIDEDREGLYIHRRITEGAEEWRRLGSDVGVVFRGALLDQAQEWRVQHEVDLNALEREFLDTSVELRMREKEAEKIRQLQAERSIWLRWTLATAVGWAVGGTVGWFLFEATYKALFGAVVKTIVGAGTVGGVAQWVVLKQQFNRAGWWVFATTMGGFIGGAVVGALVEDVFMVVEGAMGRFLAGAIFGAVIGALAGTVVGVAQWVFLKQQFNRAGWWVFATTVGWAVSWAAVVSVGRPAGWPVFGAMGWAMGGAMVGVITGRLLIWLLRRPITKIKREEN